MHKSSLENTFNSYFHDKYSFYDFCNLKVELEYKEIFYSKNTFSPSKKLKQFQKFLNFFIFDYMKVNENVVFSYRKGVSSYDAVYPHRRNKYIFSTDIKSFFRHIDVDNLKEQILKNKNNFLINPVDIEQYIDIIIHLVTYNNLLPFGAPTSPKISNAYLIDFDDTLQKLCKSKEMVYTRYSDDLIFSANNKDAFDGIGQLLENIFNELGFDKFKLNKNKTKVQKQGSRVVLLGLVIMPNGHITVDKRVKKEIETLLHFYLTDKVKFQDFLEKSFESKLKKVSGVLSHINSIDSEYVVKLKKKYGSYIVNSFIHRDIADE